MRALLILCLGFICYNTQAQTTFLKQHGFQVALYIYPTQFTFATDSNYYAVWSLQDHVGGQLSSARRFAFASYDLQGNYLSHFYIADDILFKELTNIEILGDSLLVTSIASSLSNKIIVYNFLGIKKWETSNTFINNFDFTIHENTIYTIGYQTDTLGIKSFYLSKLNNQNGQLIDSINLNSQINVFEQSNDSITINDIITYNNKICVLFSNESLNQSFIAFESDIFQIESIQNTPNKILRTYCFDTLIAFFCEASVSRDVLVYDLIRNVFFPIKNFCTQDLTTFCSIASITTLQNHFYIVFGSNNIATNEKIIKVFKSDINGNLISSFNPEGSMPKINFNNLISTPSGFFFQSPVGGGNSYYAYICAVDSCFNTNSSDFTVNLQNSDCFAPTSINENVILENTLSLFPNPTTSHFTIQSNSAIKSLTVYNLQGQQVLLKSSLNANSYTVEEQLPSGVYVVKVETEVGVEVRKVLVGSDNGQ